MKDNNNIKTTKTNNRVKSPLTFSSNADLIIKDSNKDDNGSTKKSFSDNVTKVITVEDAKRVIARMKQYPDTIWACDTEVSDIDLKTVGPVGNGKVICFSVFGGPSVDLGDGPGTILWVDTMANPDVIHEFKEWFEDESYKKVWHNYGFDRHVMFNEGIDCKGFTGDTMHMARLWDTSRDRGTGGGEGYSLESLSELLNDKRFAKISMKDLFGIAKTRKDGSESKVKNLPDLKDLQTMPQFRDKWIEYSARDAAATWWVRSLLEQHLMKMPWIVDGRKQGNLYDFYLEYFVDFGELLTDMERNGIRIDTEKHLKEAELRAREDRDKMDKLFRKWASKYFANPDDVNYMNTASTAQIQQLFFGEYENQVKTATYEEKVFKIEKSEEEYLSQKDDMLLENPYAELTTPELKKILKERGVKLSGKKSDLITRLRNHDNARKEFLTMDVEAIKGVCHTRGLTDDGTRFELIDRIIADASYAQDYEQAAEEDISAPGKVKKYREIKITTIGMKPIEYTPGGSPQVSAAILKKMAGSNLFGDEKDARYGTALGFFGDTPEGKQACQAIGALATVGQIDSTITNFLVPLQALVDRNSRIHCSLNLNTETGRLSSRRPNLQNQPALEKDQYKIRDAFIAEPGKTLIVADYGQLELRLLAHITRCTSMIEAFKEGGCFHSRTAVGMYSHIKEAVDTGKVLLEWDYSKGQPTVPLVKDTYASERRKAKTLNFSIAYGKTVHGLAQDWGITKEEAEETLAAWYSDRPEVKYWQDETRKMAKKHKYVRTLMGRYRRLPEADSRGPAGGHALRAAINTPIQGSAADVVMMAMIKLWKSAELKRLGWKLLLQIHDEVILEGPIESRDEAMKEVRECMENPWDHFGLSPLLVHLDVDAKSADSWYKAK